MPDVILGIDTSTQVCVGLARDGEPVLSVSVGDSHSHVEMLMCTVRDVLDKGKVSVSELTGIAVGMGPGPFTGLRVGIVAAQVLAWTRKIPLYHVCSLDVLGASWALTNPQGNFVACTDARRKELYWAEYDRLGHRTAGPFVSAPSELPDLPAVGPGTVVYPQVKMDSYLAIKLGLWTDGMASDWPRPEDVGEVVGIDAGLLAARAPGLPDAGPSPLYLRYADAALPGQVKSVLPARTPLPKQGSPDGDLTDAEAASEVGQ